jgi:hypothetical protein
MEEAAQKGTSYFVLKKKKKKKSVPLHTMEALGGSGGIAPTHSLTTSALDGGEWSASRPGRALPPGKGTHFTGGWVGPRAGLDTG